MGTGPWPEDLCRRCPHADACELTCPEDEPTGCLRVDEWRDACERAAEGER